MVSISSVTSEKNHKGVFENLDLVKRIDKIAWGSSSKRETNWSGLTLPKIKKFYSGTKKMII